MWQKLRMAMKNIISDIEDLSDNEIEELFSAMEENKKI